MENIKTPSFKGCYPIRENWLDDNTFVISFSPREDKMEGCDGKVTDTINQLYVEVQLDEGNRIVIGENVYEKGTTDFIDAYYHCVGNIIHDDIHMSDETAKEIKDYALAKMKSTM